MPKKNKPQVENNLLLPEPEDFVEKTAIPVGSQPWFKWLDNHSGFIYTGASGHFTARSEMRKGISYWYAYRRRDGKLSKVYLGKSENLTPERLEQVSTYLAGQIPMEELLNRKNSVDYPDPKTPSLKTFTYQAITNNQIESVSLTKIIAPTLPQNHIMRPQLSKRLKTPVTFLVAPSGYGKSTQINEWRENNNLSTAWVALDKEDNNPQRFWSMVVAAFQSINPNVGQTWFSLLYTTSSADFSKIVINLTNDIVQIIRESEGGEGICLILDNYHNIMNQVIHNSVMVLLENIPPKMKIVIASQTRPPLETGKLRSKGLIVELNVDDLKFSLDEGISFISQHAPAKKLAYRDIQKLVKRTNGWISGLVLAISALAQEEENSRFVESFTGAHPYLREFFVQNVLYRFPTDVQTFLLRTSILGQLSGSLCNAVTDRKYSAELLAQLWEERLFINYIQEVNRYYYDDLFIESLHEELTEQFPAEYQNLHRKAANWYIANQEPIDSIQHFLCCEAWNEAMELIENEALPELEKSGDGVRILRWLQQIPDSLLYQNKPLLILFIRLAMLFLPPPVVERFLTRVEIYFGAPSLSGGTGPAQMILSKIHKLHRLWITSDKPGAEFPPTETRESNYQMMDDILIFRRDYFRDLILAEKKANTVYETARKKDNLFIILMAGGACANLAFSQGHFRRSEMIAHQVLQQALRINGKLPGAASIALTALSGIYHERNQNAEAHQLLIRADEVNPNPISSDEPVMIAILRAKIQSAQGDHDAAYATIQAIRELNKRQPSSIWVDKDLTAYQALFKLQQGDLVAAERLINEPGVNDLHGFSSLARAATLMAQKRNVAAENILRQLLIKYPHGFFWLPILRVRVMLSIALFDQNKVNQASQVMAEAARLAAPEFFVRPFLVNGSKIVSLLSLVLHTENLNAGTRSFLKGVLQMLGYADGTTDIIPNEEFAALTVATSITPREQQVLRLLNANLSNQEIAEQCSISLSTVKTHLENIYRKLEVNNRTHAISQARILNLV